MRNNQLNEMEQQLQKFIKNKMFEAHHMNWGLKSGFSKKWDETVWLIDYSGEIIYYEIYTDGTFKMPSQKILQFSEMQKLTALIKQAMENQKTVEACDGTGWKMNAYNKNGTIKKSFSGYIYGIQEYEKLSEYLYSIINSNYGVV